MEHDFRIPVHYRDAPALRQITLDHDLQITRTSDCDSHSGQAGLLTETNTKPEKIRKNNGNQHQLRTRFTKLRFRPLCSDKGRQLGLRIGLYASIVALLCNTALLVTGTLIQYDLSKGSRTISKGELHEITRIKTAYHVAVNLLSMVLLASSNHTMQVLCVPTRWEIDHGLSRAQ
jgi:hypothetical protein